MLAGKVVRLLLFAQVAVAGGAIGVNNAVNPVTTSSCVHLTKTEKPPSIDGVNGGAGAEWAGCTLFQMYRGGIFKEVLAIAHICVDCSYWYMKVELDYSGVGEYIITNSAKGETYIAIDGIKPELVSFAWIKQFGTVEGWEAKYKKPADKEVFSINMHTHVYAGGKSLTAENANHASSVCYNLNCPGTKVAPVAAVTKAPIATPSKSAVVSQEHGKSPKSPPTKSEVVHPDEMKLKSSATKSALVDTKHEKPIKSPQTKSAVVHPEEKKQNSHSTKAESAVVHPDEKNSLESPPTSIPTMKPGEGGAFGDPHVKTWRGAHFDLRAECDFVLLHSEQFAGGKSLTIHIRTEVLNTCSFISDAVLRIGKETLEMEKTARYHLNGIEDAVMPSQIAGFPITKSLNIRGRLSLDVDLGDHGHITLQGYKDFVSVHVVQGRSDDFADSVGLMGDFALGRMLLRDGVTVESDTKKFVEEWQVRDTDEVLFLDSREPQFPQACNWPASSSEIRLHRRLESSVVTREEATKACLHWGDDIEQCVYDVLTTGDLQMASAGSW